MDDLTNGSVPVAVAARVYGKDASWVRAGLIAGWLSIGYATRRGKLDISGKGKNANGNYNQTGDF